MTGPNFLFFNKTHCFFHCTLLQHIKSPPYETSNFFFLKVPYPDMPSFPTFCNWSADWSKLAECWTAARSLLEACQTSYKAGIMQMLQSSYKKKEKKKWWFHSDQKQCARLK